VIDFGVAKDKRSAELTRPGEVLGSMLYTPAERLLGQPADARSDVYSIGCLMYETLTGHNPFAGDSVSEIVQNQLKVQPKPLADADLPPEVAAILEPVIFKALEK